MTIRLAANLSTLFGDFAFADRFEAAARAGFKAVELQFCDAHELAVTAAALKDCGLSLVLINAPAGLVDGEPGLAGDRRHAPRFKESIARALDFARATHCPRIHVLAGRRKRQPSDRRVLVDNMRHAADQFAPFAITLMLEALNARDRPDYGLSTLEEADRLLSAVARPNVALQFDIYHAQRDGGDLIGRFERSQPRIGHIQIAGVPGRAEPDQGEIAVDWLLRSIDARGYGGHVGCEYVPRGRTEQGLAWARPWLTPIQADDRGKSDQG